MDFSESIDEPDEVLATASTSPRPSSGYDHRNDDYEPQSAMVGPGPQTPGTGQEYPSPQLDLFLPEPVSFIDHPAVCNKFVSIWIYQWLSLARSLRLCVHARLCALSGVTVVVEYEFSFVW